MTPRERLLRVLRFEKPDRIPNMDFGYLDATIKRWHEEGLPGHLETNQQIEQFFGLEGTASIEMVPVNNGLWPPFELEIIEDRGDRRIIRNEEGVICEDFVHELSMPKYIRFPIETREDWEIFKRERLDYTREDRVTDNVRRFVQNEHTGGRPVRFVAGSLYGLLRNWMGLERFSIALMTEVDWVEEMMEHLTEMTIYLARKYLPGLEVDIAWWWEDMCYNHGPLLSPELFEKLMVPRYSRVTQELRALGIDLNILDCDGRIYELVPGWRKSGINIMFPIEVLHTSPHTLRERYGRDLAMVGGVDKIALSKGKSAIDQELEQLVPLMEEGGYIPTVDHRVPPDVSLGDYAYYLEKKKEYLTL